MIDENLDRLVRLARWRASRGIYDGKVGPQSMRLIRFCTHALHILPELQMNIIYTRDAGHHTGGWWRNPDYERCLHLSVSFRDIQGFLPHERNLTKRIVRAFWPEHHQMTWVEGPYSPEGKAANVWHYRLFCDTSWRPILPRGEVYTREHTPADWRSFSEVHGFSANEVDAPFLLAGAP